MFKGVQLNGGRFDDTIKKFQIFIFVLSILYYILKSFLGLDFTDDYFFINAATITKSGHYPPEIFFFLKIINFLYGIFGNQLIYYRILKSVIFIISLIIPLLTLTDFKNKNNFYFIVSIYLFLLAPLNSNILSYGTFTIFMLSIILCFILKSKIDSILNIIILSILFSITVAIKITNVTLFCLYFVYLFGFYYNKEWNAYKLIKTYFLTVFISTGFYALLLMVNYDSLENIKNSIAFRDAHTIRELILPLKRDFFKCLIYSVLSLIFYYLCTTKKLNFRLLGVVLFFALLKFIYSSTYHYQYSLVIASIVSSIYLIHVVNTKKINTKIFFIFLISFIDCVGSNVGLLKSGTLFIFGTLFCFEIINSANKKFIYALLIALVPFSILENFSAAYEDSNFFLLRKKIDIKGLNPILTSEKNYQFLNSIVTISDKLKKDGYPVRYYGQISHLYTFLYPSEQRVHYSSLQYINNNIEINEMLESANKNKIAIILLTRFDCRTIGHGTKKDFDKTLI